MPKLVLGTEVKTSGFLVCCWVFYGGFVLLFLRGGGGGGGGGGREGEREKRGFCFVLFFETFLWFYLSLDSNCVSLSH